MNPLSAGSGAIFQTGSISAITPRYTAVPDGLILYFGFDADCVDFTASKAIDLTGNNSGPLTNLPASSLVNGVVGQGLSFNGTGGAGQSSITLGSSILSTTSFTFSVWLYPTLAFGGSYNTIFTQGTSQGFWLHNNKFDYFTSGDNFNNTTVPSSQWSHLAFTAGGGTGRFYFNGVADGTMSTPTSISYANIGSDSPGGGSDPYGGTMDDFRFYNRTLDAVEIMQLYYAGLSGRRDAGPWLLPEADLMTMQPPAGAVVVVFRKTLSMIGTAVGRRQAQAS